MFSLLVEKVILIIALLVFSLGKHEQCKEQFSCTEHSRDWGGTTAMKIQGCTDPKAETTSCGFSVWNEGRCLYIQD